jgi:hypothetical protein
LRVSKARKIFELGPGPKGGLNTLNPPLLPDKFGILICPHPQKEEERRKKIRKDEKTHHHHMKDN